MTLAEHRRRLRGYIGQHVGCSLRSAGWHPELNYLPATLEKVGRKWAHLRYPGFTCVWLTPVEVVVPYAERWREGAA